ncbi:nucleotidyltransferase family protein [Thalassovita aquimarina]|uniref:Nucleotidyltransferase family protein n=1 Tax=Thalassovita aquimarina TaxID=2785917 RepID=A0ABS5HMY5_9RHOB|nr:nucleotidyltransferase family protein [Thalassovita aquimarina]MBR9649953.1 nucleotidyltransferase family protein [Thalassovita aquimarina]
MTIAILILAAGSSSRMGPGRDKLLEPLHGRPLLTLMLDRAHATGCPVYACLPSPSHPRARLMDDRTTSVWVPDADEGMGASIRTGIRALPDTVEAVMILPADMPELTAEDLRTVLNAYESGRIVRGTSAEGKPGHPVIFPRDCFDDLKALGGDRGARGVLTDHAERLKLIPLPARHALTDLDTPEAWANWRAGHSAE